MTRGFQCLLWCESCDRPAYECRCERWADEAREERNQLRRDAIWVLENDHPGRLRFRRSYAKLLRCMYRFDNTFPEVPL